jgi:hypothetical protein
MRSSMLRFYSLRLFIATIEPQTVAAKVFLEWLWTAGITTTGILGALSVAKMFKPVEVKRLIEEHLNAQ